jgi:sugar phosphate isomerase/epimerase
MKTMQGPAIFLAQFAGDAAPFNSLGGHGRLGGGLGYKGVQIPTWDARLFDLKKAASSKTYCDEIKGMLDEHGLQITELSTHLQGHLVAVNPLYDNLVDGFAPKAVHGNAKARQKWAVDQVKSAAKACRNLGLDTQVSFTGAFVWPFLYPFPQRPGRPRRDRLRRDGEALEADLRLLLRSGRPDRLRTAPRRGCLRRRHLRDAARPGGGHKACGINYDPSHFVLQQLDYLDFIDIYHDRIYAFHVKDAEFNPSGRQGVYSGFQPWINRAGRFRSLGDGQVDFSGIFSKLAQYDYEGGRCWNGSAA